MSRRVLVTGASSGIGAGVVAALRSAGFTVHALARRADRLEELAASTGCEVEVGDVRDHEAMAALIDRIAPDAIVLNAGLGGGFEGLANATPEEIDTVIATNVTAMLQMLRMAIPGMVARRRGHIVTMGSVAALYPSISALYGASKAAVGMTAQNLRLELRGTGLRVTDIRPGRVASEFYDVANPAGKETGIRELTPADIGEAVRYALAAPWHMNVSAIELQPVEQHYGGMGFDPVEGRGHGN